MPPSKSIAVPPNPRARPGRRIAPSEIGLDADETVLPTPAKPRPVRPLQAQPLHRFHIGERLRMSGGGYSVARAGSACKVISLLPYEGHGSLLYRVQSDSEAFERVVAEADLTR